jgi:hypothetical protein
MPFLSGYVVGGAYLVDHLLLKCTGATTAHTMEISTVGVAVANFTIGPFRCHITPVFHLGHFTLDACDGVLLVHAPVPTVSEMILIELRSRSSPGYLHKLYTYGFLF